MSECLCETCPLGAPNLTYAAVHCLHRFKEWPGERTVAKERQEPAVRPAPTAWRSNEAMPHLFTPLAA